MKSVYYCLEYRGLQPIGVTSAVFQAKGKVSNSKVALIIDVNDGKITGKQSLITWIGILSIPGALPLAIDVTSGPLHN